MKLSGVSKKMILVISILTLVVLAVGAIFFRSFTILPFAVGTLSGSLLSVVKVLMLERTAARISMPGSNPSVGKVYLQIFLRFFLTAGVLLVMALWSPPALLGAACGIFTLPIAAFAMKWFPQVE